MALPSLDGGAALVMSDLRGRAVKVLVADDHLVIRKNLRQLLQDAGMQVVGEAANGKEAVRDCERLQPDVVLLDVSMPVLNGFEAAWQIATLSPATKIVFLTGHTEEGFVDAAFDAGAVTFVHKQQAARSLIPAINAVLGDNSYVSGGTAA